MKLRFFCFPSPKRRTLAKTLLIMKLTGILLFAACLQVSANGLSQKITIKEKNVPLQKVFKLINRQTGFEFFYKDALLNQAGKINIELQDATIEEVLNVCFQNLPLTYSIVDKTIVIIPKEKKVEEIQFLAPPPPILVSGTVTDEEGNPLSDVSVIVKGTSLGTKTDVIGKFSLELDNSSKILVFSSVGYTRLEISHKSQSDLKIVMSKEVSAFNEVVVTGYGTQIRKNLSSSISKVDVGKLNTTAANSFEAALQGQAAGVQVIQGSALAGSAVNIRIRGSSSVVASSEPLYVIDGIPVEPGGISSSNPGSALSNFSLQTAANSNVLASLNPADIESIEILKDAAAAAIYGSRGSNGVVLITTKKGKAGKTKINISSSFSVSEPTHKIGLLNSQEYIEVAQEAWVNSGNPLSNFWTNSGVLQDGLTEAQAKATNTNWIDESLRTGFAQEHNLSFSGGADKTTFYISGFMKDQKSILSGNDYKNYGARLNLEYQVRKNVTMGTKMSISHVDNNQVPVSWGGGAGNVNAMLPIWPVKKDDGSYFRSVDNPVAQINLRTINLKSTQFYGSWYARASIAKGLIFRSEYGINLLNNNDFHYRDKVLLTSGRAISATQIGNNNSWNWINSLNYQKKFKGSNLDVLVATEAQKSTRKENTALGEGFFNSALIYPQDAAVKTLSYTQTGYSFNSYIGRINYDYNGKYLLSASIRADGSSRFAPFNRWGYFPSASIGYVLSEEKFFEPLMKVFNFMKVRASYGLVGNAGIGNNTFSNNYSSINYIGNAGIFLSNLGDNNLGWEKTAQLDLGLTWEALNGRISGEIDYYNKRTTDLLLGFPVSTFTGVGSITTNAGILSNKGVDIMLNTINIKRKNFSWDTRLTLNFNKNSMVEIQPGLTGGITIASGLGSTSLEVGKPVGIQRAAVWSGVDPTTGEDTYLEQTTGKALTLSQLLSQYGTFNNFFNANAIFTGNPWPKYTGGLYNGFKWKNWDMNFLFTWSVGQDFISGDVKRFLSPFGNSKYNPSRELIEKRWRSPGDIAGVSKLLTENVNFSNTTDHLYRTDYLRLKDLNIGYTFSGAKYSFLNGLRCSMRFSNLLTFTKAPDFFWDPEYSGVGFNNSNALSNDKGVPQARFYTFSLSYNF